MVSAEAGLTDVPRPDIIVVPGGPGQNDQMADGPLHAWLGPPTRPPRGPPLLHRLAGPGRRRPAAGRRATTHWLAIDQLGKFGATPVAERVVFDGKYVTAAGVSSGIDMGLTLARRVALATRLPRPSSS